jgi:hypothetical protein
LAVGAGVAVFAANGTGGGGPAPAGGGPQPAPTTKPAQICVVVRQDIATVTAIPEPPAPQQARLARRKERLARQQMRKELRKARHQRAVAVGSAAAKPLPARISAQPAPLPSSSIANIKCKAAVKFTCRHSSRPKQCIALTRPGGGAVPQSVPRLPKIIGSATVRPTMQSGARPRPTRSRAVPVPPSPGGATAAPSCTEPPNMPACPSPR